MSEHNYQLDLYQVARVHTETFTIMAGSKEDAQARADHIAKDKGLKKNFDWEIKDLNVQADAGATEPQTAPVSPPEPTEAPEPESEPEKQAPVPETPKRELVPAAPEPEIR